MNTIKPSFFIWALISVHFTFNSVSAEGDPETKIGREDEEHEDVLMNYRFGPEHLPGSRPRPTELFEYQCNDAVDLSKIRYIRISLNKKPTCSLSILGSEMEQCIPEIICTNIGTKLPKKGKLCNRKKGYLEISDAFGGGALQCKKNMTMLNPRKPRLQGKDLFLKFYGMSEEGTCEIYCSEDEKDFAVLKDLESKELPVSRNKQKKVEKSCVCGKKNNNQDGRIVGGVDAVPFEFPWLAVITPSRGDIHPNMSLRSPMCGASLITDRHVITAAHCVYMARPEDMQILLHAHVLDYFIMALKFNSEELKDRIPGARLPQKSDKDEQSLRMEIAKITIHPLYNPGTFDHDYAIIHLKQRINLKKSTSVRPVCIYPEDIGTKNTTLTGSVTVAGWGLIEANDIANARTLQKVDVPLIPWEQCSYQIGGFLTPRHLCAGFKEGAKDACQGDSGGPVIMKLKDNDTQYYQVGIVSAGYGCALPGSPGLYSNVRVGLGWIYEQTKDAIWCSQS